MRLRTKIGITATVAVLSIGSFLGGAYLGYNYTLKQDTPPYNEQAVTLVSRLDDTIKVVPYNDQYSDKNGNRPYPWGFEVWEGNPEILSDDNISHSGKYAVKMRGNNITDTVVLAIPGHGNKPNITVGETYRLEALIKLENVQGNGVRLMQQFFDSDSTPDFNWTQWPEYSMYGDFYKGTMDWTKITLDAKTTDPDNVKGDPVVELIGSGTVWVDDMKFYSLDNVSQPSGNRVLDFLFKKIFKK